MSPAGDVRIGTCTWNYDSWVGLVYSTPQQYAAAYLSEYAEHFDTAEIDSWFYRIPTPAEVRAYREAVPGTFRFSCKVPRMLTLTHLRKGMQNSQTGSTAASPVSKDAVSGRPPNSDFLSLDLFRRFLDVIDPLLGMMDALIFEFEYLNKQKMTGLGRFLEEFDAFFSRLPAGLPVALEPRNGNYMKAQYFDFIRSKDLIHVFSEKQYMPHVYDLYKSFKNYFVKQPSASPGQASGEKSAVSDTGAADNHQGSRSAVVRLLGGDRKKIEKETGGSWDKIVMPRQDLSEVAGMLLDMEGFLDVTVNVNNHYEGSAPLTVDRLRRLLENKNV